MVIEISKVLDRKIEDIIKKYPNADAALLPVLHEAQNELGYIDNDVVISIAKRLKLPESRMKSVMSFYTMYNKKPVKKHHIQVCRNISCHLRNSNLITKTIKESIEGKDNFTLTEVECLGSCGTAPVMQINNDYYENLTPQKVKDIINSLK